MIFFSLLLDLTFPVRMKHNMAFPAVTHAAGMEKNERTRKYL